MNLMFSRGMYLVLEYRVVPVIINDSLSKRTMSVVNAKFLVRFVSAKWAIVFKLEASIDIEKILTCCGQQ